MNTTFENKQKKFPVDNKYSEEMIFLNYYPTEKTSFLLQGLINLTLNCTIRKLIEFH